MQTSAHPSVDATPPTPARLFGLAWAELADVLGTTALAILMRRARDRAAGSASTLHGFGIEREGLGYRYRLPPAWSGHDPQAEADLAALVRALIPLLADLTGPIAVRRLAGVAPLRTRGIIEEEPLSQWA